MYIPSHFKEQNQSKLIEFIKTHNFANLISVSNNVPIATHLPFIVEKKEDKLVLLSHMAKANPQWQTFDTNELLIIFQGPQAYVSPKNYESEQNVPTWNYIAVHAYGKAKVIETADAMHLLMEKTINTFEKEFYNQWKNLNAEYVNGMMKAIVAFEIEVTKLEGKYKLSQNKTINENKNIIESLNNTKDSVKIELAEEMKKRISK